MVGRKNPLHVWRCREFSQRCRSETIRGDYFDKPRFKIPVPANSFPFRQETATRSAPFVREEANLSRGDLISRAKGYGWTRGLPARSRGSQDDASRQNENRRRKARAAAFYSSSAVLNY
jgi:hypothetical protein